MTDRFEIEIDATVANEKWNAEVAENLRENAEADNSTESAETVSAE